MCIGTRNLVLGHWYLTPKAWAADLGNLTTIPAGPVRPNRPKASNALTIKPDHLGGADQHRLGRREANDALTCSSDREPFATVPLRHCPLIIVIPSLRSTPYDHRTA